MGSAAGGASIGAAKGIESEEGGGSPPASPTLASVYAFGLADVPFTDNMFAMPAGNLRFTGAVDWGVRWHSTIEYFEDRTKYDPISPPPYEFVSLATTVGSLGSRVFEAYVLNDPAWVGGFATLDQTWIVENIAFSADPIETANHSAISLASRTYTTFGASPFTVNPNSTGVVGSHAMQETLTLFDSKNGAPDLAQIVTGFGMQQLMLRSLENGANAQWCTHWNNNATVPAIGDGPAWVIDGVGNFNAMSPRAAIQAYQTSNSQLGAYGWRLYTSDGLVQPMKLALDVSLAGLVLGFGAVTLPSVDTTTFPVAPAGLANVAYDDTLKAGALSVDGGAYLPISTVNYFVPAKPGALQQVFSVATIDLTITGQHTLVPPTPGRIVYVTGVQWIVKTATAVTVSPTYSIGTNSPNFNNRNVSGVTAGFTTAVAQQILSATASVVPTLAQDLTTSGLVVNVTVGATATALVAQLVTSYIVVPV